MLVMLTFKLPSLTLALGLLVLGHFGCGGGDDDDDGSPCHAITVHYLIL